jgi:hypothetical protein
LLCVAHKHSQKAEKFVNIIGLEVARWGEKPGFEVVEKGLVNVLKKQGFTLFG